MQDEDRLETSASPGKQVRGGDEVTSERVPGKRGNVPITWEDTASTLRVCLPPASFFSQFFC